MSISSAILGYAGHMKRIWARCLEILGQRATGDDSHLNAVQSQFLPAALEIQETPPSPVGRWLVVLLLGLFSSAVLWACFGHVDIVVTAPGRIVPSGQVKIVQAFEAGTVSAILVRDGDRVERGQALVNLDPTYVDADNKRIDQKIEELSLELLWRRSLDIWLFDTADINVGLEREQLTHVERNDAMPLYQQHLAEITAEITTLERERDATLAELAMARAESERVRATLPILGDRVAVHKALYDQQFGAKVAYLEMLQQRTELEQSLPVLYAKEQQLVQQLAAFDARRSATVEKHRTQNLLQIAQLESQKAALTQDAKKATQRRQQQILTAPVTGTVQQLAIHTVGGVVTPAQKLMKIVPDHVAIEVEALLQNRDIGFVTEGQTVEVKIDTFNFTKYGLIDAELVNISNDTVEDEKLGWVFKMRLKLKQDSIKIDNKAVNLSPGMAVTAEIKTGQRRLIEFFLSPLLRYRQESVRER